MNNPKEVRTPEVNPPGDRRNASGSPRDHTVRAHQLASEVFPSENRDTSRNAHVSNFTAFLRRVGCCSTKEQIQDIREEIELNTQQAQLEIARQEAEPTITAANIIENHERGLRTTGNKDEQNENIRAADERRKRAENIQAGKQPRQPSKLRESFTVSN